MMQPQLECVDQCPHALMCPICLDPLINPVELITGPSDAPPCRHMFCSSHPLPIGDLCPLCRRVIRGRQPAHRAILSLLDELQVRCTGCGSEGTRQALRSHHPCHQPEGLHSLICAVAILCNTSTTNSSQQSFLTAAMTVRDALLFLSSHAATPESVEWLSNVVSNLVAAPDGHCQWGALEVRDALICLAPRATTPESVRWLCCAVCNLAATADGERLFATLPVRDALVSLTPYTTTPESVEWLCGAFRNLSAGPEGEGLFGTVGRRDALVSLASLATTAESVRWLCCAVCNLTASPEGEHLFATPLVRDAMMRLAPRASTPQSLCLLRSSLRNMECDLGALVSCCSIVVAAAWLLGTVFLLTSMNGDWHYDVL